jgi:hypothetical protein
MDRLYKSALDIVEEKLQSVQFGGTVRSAQTVEDRREYTATEPRDYRI